MDIKRCSVCDEVLYVLAWVHTADSSIDEVFTGGVPESRDEVSLAITSAGVHAPDGQVYYCGACHDTADVARR